MDAGEEQGDAQAEIGHAMAEAARQPLDDAAQAQAAQLIGGSAVGDCIRMAGAQGRKIVAQIG